jgi:AcrR family transcriptional regulator
MVKQQAETDESSASGNVRSRIIAATARLVAAGGSDAATTRAVAAAASVQAPTIYRLFGDKDGLLDVVAEQTFAAFVDGKARREPADDPLGDLREGWDSYIAFGLANPAVFLLMSARPGRPSRAYEAGLAVLRRRVRRVALTGQLRVSEERAVDLIHAVGTGTVLALLEKAPEDRDGLAEAARDTVFATVIGDQPPAFVAGSKGAASALRACLDEIGVLSPGERQFLGELLQRIVLEP